jgi:hypothetical protein
MLVGVVVYHLHIIHNYIYRYVAHRLSANNTYDVLENCHYQFNNCLTGRFVIGPIPTCDAFEKVF